MLIQVSHIYFELALLHSPSSFWENFPYSTGSRRLPCFLRVSMGVPCSTSHASWLPRPELHCCGFAMNCEKPKKPWGEVASNSSKWYLPACQKSTSPFTSFKKQQWLHNRSSPFFAGDISNAQKDIWSLRKQTQGRDIWLSCSQRITLIIWSRMKRAWLSVRYVKPAVRCSFSCQIEGTPQDVFAESVLQKNFNSGHC